MIRQVIDRRFVKNNLKFILPLFLFISAALLYGRSISYPFVYDDVWRIATNDSIKTLHNPIRFFTDRTTQSSLPALHRDSYRPMVTLSFAVDFSLFGLNPIGYRVENILLHGLNGILVFLLGASVLSLSLPASFFGALIFLTHPVQTESVVWIVERTNVLGTFFILLTIYCWSFYQKGGPRRWVAGAYGFLILGLATREVACATPLILILIDYLKGYKRKWLHYGGALMTVAVYAIVRAAILGQVGIAPFKGGDLLTNLANVAQVWPLYWKVLFWPAFLRASYSDIAPLQTFFHPMAILGTIWLSLFMLLLIYCCWKKPLWGIALGTVMIFWLPGSNLIPLTTLFAERLLYPLMIGFGWMGGLFFDQMKSLNLRRFFASNLIVLLCFLTWAHLPVWSSDLALWANAAEVAPSSWFAWACYGEAAQKYAKGIASQNLMENKLWHERAEFAFDQALKNGPPYDIAGNLLFLLAQTKFQLGKKSEGEKLQTRAVQLNPRLAAPRGNRIN